MKKETHTPEPLPNVDLSLMILTDGTPAYPELARERELKSKMKKEIIKINTEPELPLVKIGDIVQFDSLEPVKVIKFVSCYKCCYEDICNESHLYCDFVANNGSTVESPVVMFKAIKAKE